jgi:hypothetical protein
MIHSLHIACKQQTSFGRFFMLLFFQKGRIMHNLHITLTQQTLVSQQPRSSHPPNVLIILLQPFCILRKKDRIPSPNFQMQLANDINTNMELNAQKTITIGISK